MATATHVTVADRDALRRAVNTYPAKGYATIPLCAARLPTACNTPELMLAAFNRMKAKCPSP